MRSSGGGINAGNCRTKRLPTRQARTYPVDASAQVVETARAQIAGSIAAMPEEVIFTSGATESNNLAILGTVASSELRGTRRRKIVTLAIEHPSRTRAMPLPHDPRLQASDGPDYTATVVWI